MKVAIVEMKKKLAFSVVAVCGIAAVMAATFGFFSAKRTIEREKFSVKLSASNFSIEPSAMLNGPIP